MFNHAQDTMESSANMNEAASRRRYTRRRCDRVVTQIDGKTYPVEDWSLGGALVFADSKLFKLKQNIDVNLKFKLRDRIIDVPHSGKVVRKTKSYIAVEFSPLNQNTRSSFQAVVDDHFDQIMAGSPWKSA